MKKGLRLQTSFIRFRRFSLYHQVKRRRQTEP